VRVEDSVLQAGISVRVRVEDDQHSAGYSWLKADLVFTSSSCIDVVRIHDTTHDTHAHDTRTTRAHRTTHTTHTHGITFWATW
jgi:hypothetical protein